MQQFFSAGRSDALRRIQRRNTHKAKGLIEYPTVPGLIGVVVSSGFATLYELQTVYSYEDMIDLYEIVLVNNYNERRLMEVK